MQIDEQFRQLLSGTEADPMVVHFADIPRIMVSAAPPVSIDACTETMHDFVLTALYMVQHRRVYGKPMLRICGVCFSSSGSISCN